ncbi:hypothetical protein GOC88_16745 [Sinorhizobium medicae]|nr:hypothetical protein [Sinorhizobium meliloti]MDX0424508.1 hypothetical protein [Sinorhizobium medicae]
MSVLQNSRLLLKGWSSREWPRTESDHLLAGTKLFDSSEPTSSVYLTTTFGSARRTTRAWMRIGTEDFEDLVRVMFEADKSSAIKAFAEALKATA